MKQVGAICSSSSCRVSELLAAMRGPLLPPAAVMEESRLFAQQLLREAVVVQQQLAELDEAVWPGLIEASMQEALSGGGAHPGPGDADADAASGAAV